jgi:hypothetical protein
MLRDAGSQLMLKPWHVKALWFKAALQDVLLEGQKSLTVVQWQQMCSMCTDPATSPSAPCLLPCLTLPACTSRGTTRASSKATWRARCDGTRSGALWQTVPATSYRPMPRPHVLRRSLCRALPRGEKGLRAVRQVEGRRWRFEPHPRGEGVQPRLPRSHAHPLLASGSQVLNGGRSTSGAIGSCCPAVCVCCCIWSRCAADGRSRPAQPRHATR